MAFSFGFDVLGAQNLLNQERSAQLDGFDYASRSRKRQDEEAQGLAETDALKRELEKDNVNLARSQAQRKLAMLNSGVADEREKEAQMSDFQRLKQKGDYDLGNQTKAWESANTLRMKEADQSNVAQKDRLVSQLDNQKNMQQSGFNQTNKLRSDDNRRAIDGFKMNF